MEGGADTNMTTYVYIVTLYGCNSGGHDMWTPQSKVFTSYNVAYDYFLKAAPALDDPYNKAEKLALTSEDARAYCEAGKEYIIIETRVQKYGYLDGDGTCAKRPSGAVFAACAFIQ
jgi:hypothetical protein